MISSEWRKPPAGEVRERYRAGITRAYVLPEYRLFARCSFRKDSMQPRLLARAAAMFAACTTYEGSEMAKLDGRVAVITGGSSGIGLATARKFVEEGAYLFITGRRQAELDKAKTLIGRNITTVRGDAASLEDLDALYRVVRQTKGRLVV